MSISIDLFVLNSSNRIYFDFRSVLSYGANYLVVLIQWIRQCEHSWDGESRTFVEGLRQKEEGSGGRRFGNVSTERRLCRREGERNLGKAICAVHRWQISRWPGSFILICTVSQVLEKLKSSKVNQILNSVEGLEWGCIELGSSL